jgi:hypothetical protein
MACHGLTQRSLCLSSANARHQPTKPINFSPQPGTCRILHDSHLRRSHCNRAHLLPTARRLSRHFVTTALSAGKTGTGWKGEVGWVTLCVTCFISYSGLAMLSPILPSIILKLNMGAADPAQAMGLVTSVFAASLYAHLFFCGSFSLELPCSLLCMQPAVSDR